MHVTLTCSYMSWEIMQQVWLDKLGCVVVYATVWQSYLAPQFAVGNDFFFMYPFFTVPSPVSWEHIKPLNDPDVKMRRKSIYHVLLTYFMWSIYCPSKYKGYYWHLLIHLYTFIIITQLTYDNSMWINTNVIYQFVLW